MMKYREDELWVGKGPKKKKKKCMRRTTEVQLSTERKRGNGDVT